MDNVELPEGTVFPKKPLDSLNWITGTFEWKFRVGRGQTKMYISDDVHKVLSLRKPGQVVKELWGRPTNRIYL